MDTGEKQIETGKPRTLTQIPLRGRVHSVAP